LKERFNSSADKNIQRSFTYNLVKFSELLKMRRKDEEINLYPNAIKDSGPEENYGPVGSNTDSGSNMLFNN
jgi:hypothetical protein